jgi:hypothetical protein
MITLSQFLKLLKECTLISVDSLDLYIDFC